MNNEDRASEILSRFGLEIPLPWEGSRPVWHAWHAPYPVYLMSYEEFVDRIVEIVECKPAREKAQRLRCMRPVAHLFDSPDYAAWRSADAEWWRADAERQRAYAAWKRADADRQRADADRQRADAAWRSANAERRSADDEWWRAEAAWRIADAEEILDAHAAECRDCGWDGEAMVFSNG